MTQSGINRLLSIPRDLLVQEIGEYYLLANDPNACKERREKMNANLAVCVRIFDERLKST